MKCQPPVLFICLFFTIFSHGAISIEDISGYSATHQTNSSTPLQILGGIAGPNKCSGKETCNNCSDTAIVCNEVRVHDNTEFNISLSSDTTTGHILIRDEDKNNTLAQTDQSILYPNTTHLTVSWEDICNAANSNSTGGCHTNAKVTLTIGVDQNNDGDLDDESDDTSSLQFIVTTPATSENPANTIKVCDDSETTNGACYFSAFPGDEKAYIRDLQFGSPHFNTAGEVDFNKLRVYISTTNFASTLSNDIAPQDFPIIANEEKTEFHVQSQEISGLKNNTTYFFRLAVIDQANNIAYFTDDDYIQSITIEGKKVCQLGSDFDAHLCPYTTIPQFIQGFLSEDLNCFIATATYGSKFAFQIETFRQFRNRFLLPNKLGRKLVHIYYKYSPPIARIIRSHKLLQQIVCIFLWPIWIFAIVSLTLGLWTPTILFCVSIIVFYLNKRKFLYASI